MNSPVSPTRLLFLDWLRIAAFGLLVPYHVGMYYVSWPFHVKSPNASSALEPWMMLSSPWRMSLIFLIAGAASAFMLRGHTSGAMLASRSRRLVLPLICAMLLVVPPQTYFEVVQKFHYEGSFLSFLGLYYQRYRGFCEGSQCLIMPTWNHLWFLPYLWIYTCLLWLWMRLRPADLTKIAGAMSPLLWLLVPWSLLYLFRMTLYAKYPQTHAVVHDWFNHAQYLLVFLLGAVFAQRSEIWAAMALWRKPALLIAVLSWAAFLLNWNKVPVALLRFWLASEQWFALLAAIGFACHYWNRDHPWRATLTEAVFPVYIFHQTWIIVLTQGLLPLKWPPLLEGPVLIALTFALSWASYLLVSRLGFVRPWFGMTTR